MLHHRSADLKQVLMLHVSNFHFKFFVISLEMTSCGNNMLEEKQISYRTEFGCKVLVSYGRIIHTFICTQ